MSALWRYRARSFSSHTHIHTHTGHLSLTKPERGAYSLLQPARVTLGAEKSPRRRFILLRCTLRADDARELDPLSALFIGTELCFPFLRGHARGYTVDGGLLMVWQVLRLIQIFGDGAREEQRWFSWEAFVRFGREVKDSRMMAFGFDCN